MSYSEGNLVVTVLPPAGNAVAGVRTQVLTDADVSRLASGSGVAKRNTPDLATLTSRGRELAQLLLGDQADQILARMSASKFVVVHDVASSRIPFEILSASTTVPPATNDETKRDFAVPAVPIERLFAPATHSGMYRRLAVPGVPIEQLFSRPPKAERFNLLLVINPTGDLAGAAKEGDAVEAVLKNRNDRINLLILREGGATKAALLDAFPTTDVLHYCGHAFFDGPGECESGLVLAGGERFTLADLRRVTTPRVAFVNACEAGRVRGEVTTEAASFAEFFLRSGVEAYLGTFWTVNDHAAQVFSGEVYAELAAGRTLEEAVTLARKKLLDEKLPDWANYILYGDGRFQLVT